MTPPVNIVAVSSGSAMQVDGSRAITPTANMELLLSAQLGVSDSEHSVSNRAGSSDLVGVRRMGTSMAASHFERTAIRKCTERARETPRLCRNALTEVRALRPISLILRVR